MKNTLFTVAVLLTMALSGCLKDPSASISVDKSSVSVDEAIIITLTDLENYTCIGWRVDFDGDFTEISGGSGGDLTFALSFQSAGEATITALVKNCKKSDDGNLDGCYCEKNHITTPYEVTVTIN